MKVQIYSIKDHKSGFMNPVTYMNTELAKRDFITLFNNKGNIVSDNPQDFSLFHIGELDTESGVIDSNIYHVMDAFSTSEGA
jgi:hypothetical protein